MQHIKDVGHVTKNNTPPPFIPIGFHDSILPPEKLQDKYCHPEKHSKLHLQLTFVD